MQAAPLPANEAARLEALRRYDILDTAPEEAFDEITRLASFICGTPISVMTLVDTERQWFKSKFGIDGSETPRDQAFCAHTILSPNALVVPDALKDVRFADNPLVVGDPDIRFYAGIPLITPDGFSLGALCTIDRVPRELSPEQLSALRTLANQVVQSMELRQSHRELNETAKRLSRLNEGKDQLFALISHDLRSPVGGVLGMLEMLTEEMEHMDREQLHKNMQLLANSARGTFDLLESLLQWSMFTSGQMNFHPVAINLQDLVDDLFALTGMAAQRKSISLSARLAPGCRVLADRGMLLSVLQNLVANAIKFTQSGGSITIESAAQDGHWRVAVCDSGTGMAPERLRLVMERVGESTPGTGGEPGAGLGLKICRTFVERHGSQLAAQSQPGSGTEFSFLLPAAQT